MSLSGGTSTAAAPERDSQTSTSTAGFDLPSVDQILAGLSGSSSSLPPREREKIDISEQEDMFRALANVIKQTKGSSKADTSFDLKEVHASLEQADAEAGRGCRDVNALRSVQTILHRLWSCNSGYLTQAAEILANASRDPSWRLPIGQSGILLFFLEVIASEHFVDAMLLLHSLRLVGNSCADTDENREIVVKQNYTLAIIRNFLNPDLLHVAIPVIYNICMDYEPAHSQMAANHTAYVLLRLLSTGFIKDNGALLAFSYDLIELASEQAEGIENSPDGTILLLTQLALNENATLECFSPLVNCLSLYLEKEKFQDACIKNNMVEQILSVLRQTFTINVDSSSEEDVKNLAQLRLKINQALAELSASSCFAEYYPLESDLTHTLKSLITTGQDQLQICACVMLGNLARSDKICQVMVHDLKIHKELIAVLRSNARGAVLHSALGFLKNLAIAGDNRTTLAEAGIIPAVSKLWEFESVPQVQFSAATIARQVIISSTDNIARLLAPLSDDPDSPDHQKTYLSILLSLFTKTDSSPIKTEIGRTIASICRTLSPKARDGDEQAGSLLDRLYTLHEGVAHPIGAMVVQSQWPVVRSEGWFALALMATKKTGCAAVADCLHNEDVMELLKNTLAADASEGENSDETNQTQLAKDRDNVFVLVQELLKNESGILSVAHRGMMEDIANEHASRHLRRTNDA